MSLDFYYTCPIIDNNLASIQTELADQLEDMLDDLPNKEVQEEVDSFKKDWSESLFKSIEPYIENVRSTNMDMRKAAEEQIQNIHYQKELLAEQVGELQARINELEYENNQLMLNQRD